MTPNLTELRAEWIAALTDAVAAYKTLARLHPDDAAEINEVLANLSALLASLDGAQEGWQWQDGKREVWLDDHSQPYSSAKRVLVLPMIEEDEWLPPAQN